eukprot:1632224-Amphidinium_carterae.1
MRACSPEHVEGATFASTYNLAHQIREYMRSGPLCQIQDTWQCTYFGCQGASAPTCRSGKLPIGGSSHCWSVQCVSRSAK